MRNSTHRYSPVSHSQLIQERYFRHSHVVLHHFLNEAVQIEAEFKKHFPDVRFSIVHSSYRSIENPIIRYVDIVSKNAAKQNYTTNKLLCVPDS